MKLNFFKLLPYLLLLAPRAMYGQSNIESNKLSEILSNTIEAKMELYSIFDLNVFGYFDDLYVYDTDLKKEVFKKTPEYANKLSELKAEKTEILKSTYFSKFERKFKNIDYDITKRGFNLNIGKNWGYGTAFAIAPKTIENNWGFKIYLKALPSKQTLNPDMGQGFYDEKLFLQMSETNALEIENNREDIVLYYLFTPNGKETVSFKYYSDGWYEIKDQLLFSNKVRLIVANKVTDKVYFDKTYTY